MSAHPSHNSPWPAQTPAAVQPSFSGPKRRRTRDTASHAVASSSQLASRQIVTDQSQISALHSPRSFLHSLKGFLLFFPAQRPQRLIVKSFLATMFFPVFPQLIRSFLSISGPVLSVRALLSFFIQLSSSYSLGNSRNPNFLQTEKVNIYLFRADSGRQVLSIRNKTNPVGTAGYLAQQVNDSWWGDEGVNWSGTNISYPFYWIVTRNDKELDGTESTQPIFSAIRAYQFPLSLYS